SSGSVLSSRSPVAFDTRTLREDRSRQTSRLLSFLAEYEPAFRGIDGTLGTGVRVAQDSLCSTRMRLDGRVGARCRPPENRLDHFLSERDEGAAQTELHVPVAATELHSELLGQVLLLS